MSEGLTRRVIGPCLRPRVVSAIRRAPTFTAASVVFETSKRGLGRATTAAAVFIASPRDHPCLQDRGWRYICEAYIFRCLLSFRTMDMLDAVTLDQFRTFIAAVD